MGRYKTLQPWSIEDGVSDFQDAFEESKAMLTTKSVADVNLR